MSIQHTTDERIPEHEQDSDLYRSGVPGLDPSESEEYLHLQ